MYQRTLSKKLLSLASQFPVVFLTGPRQSGKTTLARALFSSHIYLNLEDPGIRDFALRDPNGLLHQHRGSVIFDEVQRAPDLLSAIQVIVDEDPSPERFILTGSQQLPLAHTISQTLAGRAAVCVLLPLGLSELLNRPEGDPWTPERLGPPTEPPDFELDSILHKGLFPRIHDRNLLPPHH